MWEHSAGWLIVGVIVLSALSPVFYLIWKKYHKEKDDYWHSYPKDDGYWHRK